MTTYALQRLAEERQAALRLEAERHRSLPRPRGLRVAVERMLAAAELVAGSRRHRAQASTARECCA